MRIKTIIASLALLVGASLPSLAEAANAYATGNVNIRTGPGTQYARTGTIPAGATLTIRGCLNGYSWCEVIFAGQRGWASSNYLQATYQNRRQAVIHVGPIIGLPVIVHRPQPPHWGHRPRPPHWEHRPRPPRPPHGDHRPRPPRPQPR
ncbi:SH3 domain-containing protein [Agrobacterium tumefaciens]|uniref:SH3 domain-containing protein n=1 Tax=Rhizobium sp. TaxID=391 RepID=UPI000ED90D66|nr:SH3 domain-containing protein [Agrobacterium tumefaciens]HCD84025.1 SH3 domain-containing protein [Agrobacterium sp.]